MLYNYAPMDTATPQNTIAFTTHTNHVQRWAITRCSLTKIASLSFFIQARDWQTVLELIRAGTNLGFLINF